MRELSMHAVNTKSKLFSAEIWKQLWKYEDFIERPLTFGTDPAHMYLKFISFLVDVSQTCFLLEDL